MTPNALNITSIGRLSQLAGAMPSRIAATAAALGIRPAATIDGVAHFGDADAERIVAEIQAALTGRVSQPANANRSRRSGEAHQG